jgi:hypothetical protein
MSLVYVKTKEKLPEDSDFMCSLCQEDIDIDEITEGQPNCVICENGHRLHRECYNKILPFKLKQLEELNSPEKKEKFISEGGLNVICPLCKSEMSLPKFCKSILKGYSYRPSKGGKGSKKKKTYKKRKMCKKRKTKHNRSLNYKRCK